jgi:hypothetical protein
MAARTEIHFRGGELVVVEGAASDVAIELGTQGGAVGLVTIEGAALFANWGNVLYVQEIPEDSPHVPPFGGPPGRVVAPGSR